MLADTNILIGIFKGLIPKKNIKSFDTLMISGITYTEFLADPKFSSTEMRRYKNILEKSFVIINPTISILFKAAQILNQKTLKLGDALIVATALENSQQLCTLDKVILRKFPKLTVLP